MKPQFAINIIYYIWNTVVNETIDNDDYVYSNLYNYDDVMYAQVRLSFWENFVYVLNGWLLTTTKNNYPKFLQISFPDEV